MSQQSWSTEEGLPDASVNTLLQARDGYLWFGTEGGAARFDGFNFVLFRRSNEPAFQSDDVTSSAQTADGTLWFGTAAGLVAREGEHFRRFGTQEGLPSAAVRALAAGADGLLYVQTDQGIAVGNGRGFHLLVPVVPDALAFAHDGHGEVVLLARGGQLLTLLKGRVVHEQQLPLTEDGAVLGMQEGSGGAVWLFSARSVSLQGGRYRRVLKAGRELPPGRIQALCAEGERAWIGTSRGLFLLRTPSGVPEQVPAFRDESILSLLEDREGNLWVGTEASGLHILRPRKFRAVEGTLGEPVTAVVVDGEGVPWAGTRDRGLRRLGAAGAEEHTSSAALTSYVILSLGSAPHRALWAGTPDGLNRLGAGAVRSITAADGLPDDFVRSLQVDAAGVVWAGTRRGLARIAPEGQLRTLTTADGLGSDSVGALLLPMQASGIASAEDRLWVGTAAGLSEIEGKAVRSFVPVQGPGKAIVTALAQGTGRNLLVAVHGAGLFTFDGQAFRSVAAANLPLDITSMLTDRLGFVWLRSAQGLQRVRVRDLEHCAATAGTCGAAISSFSSADGLPTVAVAAEGSPQLALGPDGRVWIATAKGVAVADPASLPQNRVPPPIAVQSFTVDGAAVPTGDGPVTVSPGHSRYNFSFAALSYTMPSKVRYRTFLQGFDHEWANNGTERVATYTSLPPRHYRFLVQAQNNDGVWSRSVASVDFVVQPPLYQRWWLYLLLACAAAALVLGGFRLRERAVQRRFALVLEERNRLAREIHDTLAQDFVSMSLQLEIATSLLKQQQVERAMAQLGTMRQAIKDGLRAARQSIWDLRASAGEDSLPARLTALASRYSISGKPPRLTIGGAFRALPASVESEVLRIAQEGLTNIDRHAHATEASVELQYETQTLLLKVEDNGRGFGTAEAAALQGHFGLQGMRERAAALRASLDVESGPGEGTTITLRVPLRDKEPSAR